MNVRASFALLAMLALMACQSGPRAAPADIGNFPALIESERATLGLGGLTQDARLSAAAQAHAADMVARGYFSHAGANGSQFSQRARTAGYPCAAAENIAAGQGSAERVMAAWMSSSGHRRNILLIGARDYGIGRVDDTWVLMLGRGC